MINKSQLESLIQSKVDTKTFNDTSNDFLSNVLSADQISEDRSFYVETVDDLPNIFYNQIPNGFVVFVKSINVPVIASDNEWIGLDGRVLKSFNEITQAFAWGYNNRGQLGDSSTFNRSSPVSIVGGFTDWCLLESGVNSGNSFSLGIRTNGTLWSWGNNGNGYLGDGTTIGRSSPVSVLGGFTDWCNVSVGRQHVLALRSNGTIWSWGLAPAGTSLISGVSSPVSIISCTPTWVYASMGSNHSHAIRKDGSLWGWGCCQRLGIGDISGNSTSAIKVNDTICWSKVSSGRCHSLGLSNANQLFVWGCNQNGQLGNNTTVNCFNVLPLSVFNDWTEISAGYDHSAAIRTNGTLWTWGANGIFQLGNGCFVPRSSPGVILGGFTDWCQVSAGNSFTAALRTNGTLWAWGYNIDGRLGDGTTTTRSSPVSVVGGFTDWCKVKVGRTHTVALRSNGTAWTWGANGTGALGDGTTTQRSSPVSVLPNNLNESWSDISAGSYFTIAKSSSNKLWGWGRSSGNGFQNTCLSSPARIATNLGFNWSQISSFCCSVFALSTDGTILGWGSNTSGQLGRGDLCSAFGSTARPTLGANYEGTNNWCTVSAGRAVSFSVKDDGTLWSWGSPGQGMTGTGQYATSPNITILYPKKTLDNFTDWRQIKSGRGFFLGLRDNGTIWGAGNVWGLGQGRGWRSYSPIKTLGTSWCDVSNGLFHTLAVDKNGGLFGWGSGLQGRLGLGNESYKFSPTLIGPHWKEISRHNSHTLAIYNDGTLWAWGVNGGGELGDGTITNRSSPVSVVGGFTDWCQVSTGVSTSGALRTNGSFWAWGGNSFGTLGDGTTVYRSSPVSVIGGFTDWCRIKTRSNHTLAIRTNGTLWAWGKAVNGELGTNNIIERSSPVSVIGGFTDWCDISTGFIHSVGLKTNGSLWAWGYNGKGEVGDNTTIWRSSPVTVVGGFTDWCKIGSSDSAVFAIRNNGTLWSWGCGRFGQLGNGTTVDTSSPAQVLGGFSNWCDIDSGVFAPIAQQTDGSIWIWGDQSGDGTTIDRSSPVQLSGNQVDWCKITGYTAVKTNGTLWNWDFYLGNNTSITTSSPVSTLLKQPTLWCQVSAGNFRSTALRSDGSIWSWGSDRFSRLGLGNFPDNRGEYWTPTQIKGCQCDWIKVSSSYRTTAALKNNGTIWTWGVGVSLGIGGDFVCGSPVSILGGFTDWCDVESGYCHVVALRTNGTLWSWGYGNRGSLGTGNTICRASPVQEISYATDWCRIAGGDYFSTAIKNNGTMWAWGRNSSGQIGDGTDIDRSSPVSVIGGFTDWCQVSSRSLHTAAIRSNGTLWAWGGNIYGQLGDGTNDYRSSPVSVIGGFTDWCKINTYLDRTSAIRTNGEIWNWGEFIYSSVGNGVGGFVESPVSVIGGFTDWCYLDAGENHGAAIRQNGTLWTWGNNAGGKLGLNFASRAVYSPVSVVGGFTDWCQVSAGCSNTIALRSNGTLWTWGSNFRGQLGDGTTNDRPSPVSVLGGFSDWCQISIGNYHTLGIRKVG